MVEQEDTKNAVRYKIMNIEKEILKKYGDIVYYSELQKDQIKKYPISGREYHLMYIIKESEIERFTSSINNEDGLIRLSARPMEYRTSCVDLKEKQENYLEVELCVKEQHFIPDRISKDDILFFFKRNKNNSFYIMVKNEYVDQLLNSEHSIFGMIDFCDGKKLLFTKDSIVKPKMDNFYKEIEFLAKKYQDVLFFTISDSVLIKYSFKIIKEDILQSDCLDFQRIIEIFKEIRRVIREIFEMDSYGVFTYGMNKCKTPKSDSMNLFHTGILSNEFKQLMKMEETCRKFKKEERGDVYISDVLYFAYRYHFQEKYKDKTCRIPFQSSSEWSTSDKNITAMKITDDLNYL